MRITRSNNTAGSKRYFELSDCLEHDPNKLLKGHWLGMGAALLGLSGEVDKEYFDNLIDNKRALKEAMFRHRPEMYASDLVEENQATENAATLGFNQRT